MQFQEATNLFIAYLQFEKRYSQHTIGAYQNDLAQFSKFLQEQYETTDVREVKASFVRSWLAEVKNAAKANARTINRKISSLKSFYQFLLRQQVVATSPMGAIVSQKAPKRLPQFVAEKDMDKLWRYTDFPDTWNGRTGWLILQLFYNTGMRLAELVNLKEAQLDPSNLSLKILGKGSKERIIPCSRALMDELIGYRDEKKALLENPDHSVLFVNEKGKKLYPKWVYNAVRKYLDPATTIEKRSPHVLRHTFATHLLNEGAGLNAVKELLGHSSLAATQVYTHNTIGKLKDVFKKAHPKA